MLFDLAKQ